MEKYKILRMRKVLLKAIADRFPQHQDAAAALMLRINRFMFLHPKLEKASSCIDMDYIREHKRRLKALHTDCNYLFKTIGISLKDLTELELMTCNRPKFTIPQIEIQVLLPPGVPQLQWLAAKAIRGDAALRTTVPSMMATHITDGFNLTQPNPDFKRLAIDPKSEEKSAHKRCIIS